MRVPTPVRDGDVVRAETRLPHKHRGWQPSQASARRRVDYRSSGGNGVGTAGSARRFRGMATEFYFTPELHLKDGRIIRDLDDAASFARDLAT